MLCKLHFLVNITVLSIQNSMVSPFNEANDTTAKAKPGKPNQRGSLSTLDLLLQTSLDQLLFILKILITF